MALHYSPLSSPESLPSPPTSQQRDPSQLTTELADRLSFPVFPPLRITALHSTTLPKIGGTEINIIARAAHLTNLGHNVLCLIPGISVREQKEYGFPVLMRTVDEHRAYIKEYIDRQSLPFRSELLDIDFYPAFFSKRYGGIFPSDYLHKYIPHDTDIVLVEEPEGIFLFQPFYSLKKYHHRVIGFHHTDVVNAMQQRKGLNRLYFQLYKYANRHSILRNCHKILSICDVDWLPEALTEAAFGGYFIGVIDSFFGCCRRKGEKEGAYWVGRMDRDKGWDELISFSCHTPNVLIHVYNTLGKDKDLIEQLIEKSKANLILHGPTFTPAKDFSQYRVLVFTARSGGDTRNTSVAQATCLGQWVLVPKGSRTHVCYKDYKNVLPYEGEKEFHEQLDHAFRIELDEDRDLRERLNWRTACLNLLKASVSEDVGKTDTWQEQFSSLGLLVAAFLFFFTTIL